MAVTYVETEKAFVAIARDMGLSADIHSLTRPVKIWGIFPSDRWLASLAVDGNAIMISYGHPSPGRTDGPSRLSVKDLELIKEYAESLSDEGIDVVLDYAGPA